MYKPIAKEIREEILSKVKQGKYNVPELAKQYAVSDKTIYTWLRKKGKKEISLVEFNRLKRQNEELKRIIGELTYGLEKKKKDGARTKF